jgi:hypothetical protein
MIARIFSRNAADTLGMRPGTRGARVASYYEQEFIESERLFRVRKILLPQGPVATTFHSPANQSIRPFPGEPSRLRSHLLCRCAVCWAALTPPNQ